MDGLGFGKDAVKQMSFSRYLEDSTLPNEHCNITKACAKLLLKRLGNIPPSLILQDPAHLDFFLREAYVVE